MIFDQIDGGLILMGLERAERSRTDLTVGDNLPQSEYKKTIDDARISRFTAKRWQVIAWAAGKSRRLSQNDE